MRLLLPQPEGEGDVFRLRYIVEWPEYAAHFVRLPTDAPGSFTEVQGARSNDICVIRVLRVHLDGSESEVSEPDHRIGFDDCMPDELRVCDTRGEATDVHMESIGWFAARPDGAANANEVRAGLQPVHLAARVQDMDRAAEQLKNDVGDTLRDLPSQHAEFDLSCTQEDADVTLEFNQDERGRVVSICGTETDIRVWFSGCRIEQRVVVTRTRRAVQGAHASSVPVDEEDHDESADVSPDADGVDKLPTGVHAS